MQVDFTTIKRGHAKLEAFEAKMGFSRSTYVRFSTHVKQDDWISGIREALHYFGGAPKEVLFDNAKCLMNELDAYGIGRHRWNKHLVELASVVHLV